VACTAPTFSSANESAGIQVNAAAIAVAQVLAVGDSGNFRENSTTVCSLAEGMPQMSDSANDREAKRAKRVRRDLILRRNGIGEPGSQDPSDFQTLGRASFVSGLREDEQWAGLGNVLVNVVGPTYENEHLIKTFSWDDLELVEFESANVEKSRVAPVLAFGVLGLGAKATSSESVLTLEHKNGQHFVFIFREIDPISIRTKLKTTLTSVGRRLGERMSDSSNKSSEESQTFVQALVSLGEMVDRGLLTTDEFQIAKDRLIREG
jgi:hypothetical protein